MTFQKDGDSQAVHEDASHPQASPSQSALHNDGSEGETDFDASETNNDAAAGPFADDIVQLAAWDTPSRTARDNATKLVLSLPRWLDALQEQTRNARANWLLGKAKSDVGQWSEKAIELIESSGEAAEVVASLREVSRLVKDLPLTVCRKIRDLGEFSDSLVFALVAEQVWVIFRLMVMADVLAEEEGCQLPDTTDEEHIPRLGMRSSLPMTELMADSIFLEASFAHLCREVGEDEIDRSMIDDSEAFWSKFHEGCMELHDLAFPGAPQSSLEIVREATKGFGLRLLNTDVHIKALKTGPPLTRIVLTIPWFFDGQVVEMQWDPGQTRMSDPTFCLAPVLKLMTRVDDIHFFTPEDEVSYTKVIGETEGGPVHLYLSIRSMDTAI